MIFRIDVRIANVAKQKKKENIVGPGDGHGLTLKLKMFLLLGVGKPLPKFEGIKLRLSAQQTKDRAILLCFFDMNQRPSRNCVMELAKHVQDLKRKGLTVAAVQMSKVDGDTLDEWMKKNKIPFCVGMIEGDKEKIRFTWGVKSLPWLILTDREHVVRSEGFAFSELENKLNQIKGD